MKPADFGPLARLHELCQAAAVSWSVAYNESSDDWTFDITSAAPAERFHIKKTADFGDGVARCLAHLAAIGYGGENPA